MNNKLIISAIAIVLAGCSDNEIKNNGYIEYPYMTEEDSYYSVSDEDMIVQIGDSFEPILINN